MRHVDLKNIDIPEQWLEKAVKLQKELEDIPALQDKLNHIEENQIWRDKSLFKALSDAMDGKCWYSEAKELMSDRDIDHFRPKKKAKNIDKKERDGYWFLAYDWENYRFSSIYSNRLRKDKFSEDEIAYGKGIYFPLKEGSPIAKTKKQLEDERPYLIDPAKKGDAALISFNVFGKVVPGVPSAFSWDIERVQASVTYYHLDHQPLRTARVKKWNVCQMKIDKIKELCSDPCLSKKDEDLVEFMRDELIQLADDKELLSGVVIACLDKNNMSSILTL